MSMNRRLALALGITAIFGVAVVQAEELGRADVRFAFEARGQRLAAGIYSAVEKEGALLVRNDTTGQRMFFLPVLAELTNSVESSMTFRCYGAECFLSRIQIGRSHKIYKIIPEKHEKELANIERPRTTVVAMR